MHLLILLVGLAIGIVGGMVGIGGGVLLIPALMYLFKYQAPQAAGISLAVLAVPVTLPGAWKYFSLGRVTPNDFPTIACLAIAFGLGTYLGAGLQARLDPALPRLIFGLLLLFVGVRAILYTSPEVVQTASALTAVGLGWVVFLFLRALGRKHRNPPPELGQEIRRRQETGPRADDYYI